MQRRLVGCDIYFMNGYNYYTYGKTFMKILFLNVPMRGHINPTLPMVEELVLEGHQVDYYCIEKYRATIEERGAKFCEYGVPFSDIDPKSNSTIVIAYLFAAFAKATADKFMQKWKKANYDLVIHDSCAYAGVLLHKQTGIKAINSTTTMFYTPEIVFKTSLQITLLDLLRSLLFGPVDWVKFLTLSLEFRKSYSVFPSVANVLASTEEVNITYTSREIQPIGESLDPNKYKFLGSYSATESRAKDESFPYSKLKGNQVIYVSLGTVYTNNVRFFRNCFAALKTFNNVSVVVSIGSNINFYELGEIPDNFVVRPFVPQLDILEVADLFISHAGYNSINESLTLGCPMVLCPQQGEQRTVARQLAKRSLGVSTDRKCPTIQQIRKAVETVLANELYKKYALEASHNLKAAREKESIGLIVHKHVVGFECNQQ